jgi:hypothetical protein
VFPELFAAPALANLATGGEVISTRPCIPHLRFSIQRKQGREAWEH